MKVTVIDYGLSTCSACSMRSPILGQNVQVTSQPGRMFWQPMPWCCPAWALSRDGSAGAGNSWGLIEPIKQKTAQGTLLLGDLPWDADAV